VGYPILPHTRLSLSYLFDVSDITITDRDKASSNIERLEGENTTSSLTPSLVYDTRDNPFVPSRGLVAKGSVEYAGLGGDFEFTKYKAETAKYWPLFWKLVGMTRVQGGYITGNKVPDYERFFVGGINTIRGVESEDISPTDPESDDANPPLIGGESYGVLNLELIFPIGEDMGLYGVTFYDTGDVWEEGENPDFGALVSTAGGGLRWQSPFGALRLEYGFVVDAGNTDASGGKLEFTMGSTF
jgi:outer membrane protein insertion porin family